MATTTSTETPITSRGANFTSAVTPVAEAAPKPRVLFVDDEPAVLDGITSNLRRSFDVLTATSGAAGLELLRANPSLSVVVSDMRMPAMNGAVFLTKACEAAPDVVRMLLTGQADLESAIAAVNQGRIFRFLTKPCKRDDLLAAVRAACEQHRLITAERELLEQTLRGAIAMLVDILAQTNPAAFGRSNRIKTRVLEIAGALQLASTWQLEIAALASQLGYIVLPREISDKLAHGRPLTGEERRLVAEAPEGTARLLANIPRLETVREILALHVAPPRREPGATGQRALVQLGAHVLRFALDVDELESESPMSAVDVIRSRGELYDPEVVAASERARLERVRSSATAEVAITALRPGMTLAEDVRFTTGALLVASGYEVTASFIARLKNLPPGAIRGPFRIVA